MKKAFFIFPVILTLISCNNEKQEKIEVIDIASAFGNPKEIFLSSFATEVTYVPLETRPEAALSRSDAVVTDKYILYQVSLISDRHLFLFDRSTGAFIREIGISGRGPGEYFVMINDYYDYKDKKIIAKGNSDNLIIYDLEGNVTAEIKLPQVADSLMAGDGYISVPCDVQMSPGTFAGYYPNIFGKEKKKVVVFKNDSIIRTFRNYLSYESNMKALFINKGRRFFRDGEELLFKEQFNDTVFSVRPDTLLPLYFFKAVDYSIPYEMQHQVQVSEKMNDYYDYKNVAATKDFIFIEFRYQSEKFLCIYDKNQKKAALCSGDKMRKSAITDDINGFISLIPSYTTPSNEMICVLEALDIVRWRDDNPEKAKALKDKLPWLENYSEMDNPVVVIAKCK